MIVFFFTASSISRNQTSHKGRNVIEENVRTYNDQPDDWIIFHSVSISCKQTRGKTETLCYINGSDV